MWRNFRDVVYGDIFVKVLSRVDFFDLLGFIIVKIDFGFIYFVEIIYNCKISLKFLYKVIIIYVEYYFVLF